MTNQEVFDRVVKHLAEQKRPAVYNGRCVYRVPNCLTKQLKCAIGCLIPDECYSPDLEGLAISEPRVLNVANLSPSQFPLAVALQYAHDNSDSLYDLQANLSDTALEFDLDDKSIQLIEEWHYSDDDDAK